MKRSTLCKVAGFFSSIPALSLILMILAPIGAKAATDPGSTPKAWGQQSGWISSVGNEEPTAKKSIARRTYLNPAPFTPGSQNLSIDVGQVFLMGGLSDRYSDSIGSQLHYTFGVSEMFGFDASVGYSAHSDGAFSVGSMLTGLRVNLAWYDKVIPYFIAGLGFYRPSFDVDNSPTSISSLLFGLHAGPGVNLELTRNLFFGASLTFHDIFGTQKMSPSGQLFDVDGTFTSFFLTAGVTF